MSETQPNSISTDSLPPTPRPITAKVRRRSLQEPITRSWAMLAALILVTFLFVTVQGYLQWRTDARMVESGPIVQAIGFADGAKIKGRPLPIGQTVYIEYEYNGKKITSQGPLMRTGEQYIAGEPFGVRLDPDDPTVWSNRKQPTTLREKMIGSILTLAFLLTSGIVAWLLRWRTLSLWREGEVRQAKVLEHRQSALAPRSVALYCAVRMMKKENLMTVYVPQSGQVPAVGQSVPLLTNEKATRGIALTNYHA